jgi:CRISPR-associated protein Csb2
MLPNATEPEARVALLHALRGLREVYCRAGRVAIEIVPTAIDTDSFWRTPEPGMVRRWRPLPALVPEVRRQVGTSGKPWTLANAAAVSAAFVFRDEFPDGFAGPNRYARAAEAAEARGFRISEVRILADSRTQRYAHKMPKGVIMQPYTGLVDLGSFSSARRLLALGQSRHLGGGLLWPEDLPLPIAEARGLL